MSVSSTSTGDGLGGLSWIGIVRLGLVQTALGAIVVLTTSTLNRVMVVELALPAMLPGALVAIHYAVQMLRPRWGHGSDMGGRRTPWIIGGMATLALGGVGAAASVALMESHLFAGTAAAVAAFLVIGVGVGASGTSLLVLLATEVSERRRPAAASIVWLMMIAGFVVTTITAGSFLDPYTPARLVAVSGSVSAIAVLVTIVAVWGIETGRRQKPSNTEEKTPFLEALGQVWAEPMARRFAIFVFVSMLAYSAQDLVLEPFAGAVFGFTPGESTKLSGTHHGGVFVGMITVGALGTWLGGITLRSMRTWVMGGCLASAVCLIGLAVGGAVGPGWPLKANVFALGFANGAFAVAAIGSMMGLAGVGRQKREGVRMGVWGAAQAIAFGLGGFLGTVAVDATRAATGTVATAYGTVFVMEGLLFVAAALLALRVGRTAADQVRIKSTSMGDGFAAGMANQ